MELLQRAIAAGPERKRKRTAAWATRSGAAGKSEEAAAAYARAVELRPDWAEAHGSLGDVFREQGKFDRAIDQYNTVIRLKPALPAGYLNLGRALQGQGKHAEAVSAYQKSSSTQSGLGGGLRRTRQRASGNRKARRSDRRFYESVGDQAGVVRGGLEPGQGIGDRWAARREALVCFQRAAKLNPNNAHAHFFLACRLVKAGRMRGVDRGISRRHCGSSRIRPTGNTNWPRCRGTARSKRRPPNTFEICSISMRRNLTSTWSKTEISDSEIVIAARAGGDAAKRDMDVLDLGCGTGLCGVEFRPYARRMVGVDLSPAMLKVAESRKIYDQLTAGDLMPPLRAAADGYDLIFAGDVLVYVGDLSEFMPAVARALRAGGLLACSIEDYDGTGFFLHSEERFAHSIAYFRELATASGLKESSANKVILRRNKDVDVYGWILVFGKP